MACALAASWDSPAAERRLPGSVRAFQAGRSGSRTRVASQALGCSCTQALLGLIGAISFVMRCLSSFGVLISQKNKEKFKKFSSPFWLRWSCAAPSLPAFSALTRSSWAGRSQPGHAAAGCAGSLCSSVCSSVWTVRTPSRRAVKPSGHVPPVRAVRLPSQAAGRLSSQMEGDSGRPLAPGREPASGLPLRLKAKVQ